MGRDRLFRDLDVALASAGSRHAEGRAAVNAWRAGMVEFVTRSTPVIDDCGRPGGRPPAPPLDLHDGGVGATMTEKVMVGRGGRG